MGGRRAGPPDPATAPMLSLGPAAMERLNHELAVQRDRFVRLQSVQKDLMLDLPHSIPLPDGEEIPYGSSTYYHIRDPQQESEIYQTCIRPPPNKTVFDGDSPPPYRPGGRGRVSKKSDFFDRTARYLGMKRHEEPAPPPPPTPPPPCVYVPVGNRSRQLAAFSKNGNMNLASVPTVSCSVSAPHMMTYPRAPAPAAQPGVQPGDILRSHPAGVTTSFSSQLLASGRLRAPAPAVAGASGFAPNEYRDTKGPEIKRAPAPAVAGASGFAPKEYRDTKGPEIRRAPATAAAAAAGASGYATNEYHDTKGPEIRRAPTPAAAASGSASNEDSDAKGTEKKSERTSV